ncbi:MAG: hypothetical protein HY455_03340 [Parcubacteria group bacterium]|nr:hypothetical protein [Parcubacteria group bacterium]
MFDKIIDIFKRKWKPPIIHPIGLLGRPLDFYTCTGCGGIGFYAKDKVLHHVGCPHYPSEGDRESQEMWKARPLPAVPIDRVP